MIVDLLDKTRKINGLLRDNHASKVAFTDLCQVLGNLVASNVYVISSKGKILGMSLQEESITLSGIPALKGKRIDSKLSKRLLEVLSTKENVNLELLGIASENCRELQALIVPVYIAGERLGTLFLYRRASSYGVEDIILAEYSTTVVGLEMIRSVTEEKDDENRKQQSLDSVLNILSPLERRAVEHVVSRLETEEGMIIASRLAKEVGITRTVIVNALKKMESAGLLETKSCGVKGTYIKILDDIVVVEFEHNKK